MVNETLARSPGSLTGAPSNDEEGLTCTRDRGEENETRGSTPFCLGRDSPLSNGSWLFSSSREHRLLRATVGWRPIAR